MIDLCKCRVVFTALLLLILFSDTLFAKVEFDFDLNISSKTKTKMQEIGKELFDKSGISTVVVAKKYLNKKEFLELKDSYLKELKAPYVLWIFAKEYFDEDVNRTGRLNLIFNSDDLKGKFDQDSMFSPFSGSFTKLIVIQKSKTDPTSAAFLNGYGDLTDMLADSYGIKLDSSLGDETRETMDIARVFFYLTFLFFFIWYIKVKFFNRG